MPRFRLGMDSEERLVFDRRSGARRASHARKGPSTFLRSSAAAALSLAVPTDLFAQATSASAPASANWDAGGLRHLLPTVSDTRMLVKTSFGAPLMEAPTLSVGGTSVRGRMGIRAANTGTFTSPI
jgi:hypothetical protein